MHDLVPFDFRHLLFVRGDASIRCIHPVLSSLLCPVLSSVLFLYSYRSCYCLVICTLIYLSSYPSSHLCGPAAVAVPKKSSNPTDDVEGHSGTMLFVLSSVFGSVLVSSFVMSLLLTRDADWSVKGMCTGH